MGRPLTNRVPADALDPGEVCQSAQAMVVKGNRWLRGWLESEDRATDLVDRVRRHGVDPDPHPADLGLPTGIVVALTGSRVVVLDRSFTGRPRTVVAAWPVDEISLDTFDLGDRVRSRLFVLGLPDGAVFAGEAGVNGTALDNADAFVGAFRELALLH